MILENHKYALTNLFDRYDTSNTRDYRIYIWQYMEVASITLFLFFVFYESIKFDLTHLDAVIFLFIILEFQKY